MKSTSNIESIGLKLGLFIENRKMRKNHQIKMKSALRLQPVESKAGRGRVNPLGW